MLGPGTERGNATVQGGDHFLVAADETITRIETMEFPHNGPKGIGGSYSGHINREVGLLAPVSSA